MGGPFFFFGFLVLMTMLHRIATNQSLRAARTLPSVALRGYASKAEKSIKLKVETPYETFKCDGPSTLDVTTTASEMMDFYKTMYSIRRLEVMADNLYKEKMIRGFLHLYTGQEAVATGIQAALTMKDAVTTAYRCHGWMYVRGGTPESIISELIGKDEGCSRGKGGSMHMFNRENSFYGGTAIVGAQIPTGAGVAFAYKYRKEDNVSVVAFGDGAANQGQYYEAMNMSSLWDLPVIYLVENNHYGMGTSTSRAAADVEFYKRGAFVPGIRVDGMDVFGVKHATQYCVDFVKSNGPIVLECSTYRYVGHSMSDPGTSYRTRTEIDEVRNRRDPIEKVRTKMIANKVATEDELKAIDKEIRTRMSEAVKEAKSGHEPNMRELFTDIYARPTPVRHVERELSFEP